MVPMTINCFVVDNLVSCDNYLEFLFIQFITCAVCSADLFCNVFIFLQGILGCFPDVSFEVCQLSLMIFSPFAVSKIGS